MIPPPVLTLFLLNVLIQEYQPAVYGDINAGNVTFNLEPDNRSDNV